jgi:uncharacterized membrane protein
MEPLIVLIIVFISSAGICKLSKGDWNLPFAGNMGMCLMLFITAIGHVLFAKGMAMMIPPFVPLKMALVYLTGLAEVIFGLALLSPSKRSIAGYVLILFFVLILPANLYAAITHLDLEKATYTGPGLNYLWFRIPEQVFFIAWIWYFSIRQPRLAINPA